MSQKTVIKEREIQKLIMQYLRFQGYFVFKNHQTLGSYPGVADLYAIKDRKQFWIEVKTENGKQSDAQKKFEEDIKTHGGMYIIARSLDDVIEAIA